MSHFDAESIEKSISFKFDGDCLKLGCVALGEHYDGTIYKKSGETFQPLYADMFKVLISFLVYQAFRNNIEMKYFYL